jgi:hypothetical protein
MFSRKICAVDARLSKLPSAAVLGGNSSRPATTSTEPSAIS